jgi:carboxyl-terminal processing protease
LKILKTMDSENIPNNSSITPLTEDLQVQKRHKARWFGIVLIVIVGFGASFQYGLNLGRQGYVFVPKEFKVMHQADQPATVDYSLLWKAIDVVTEKYIEKPVDQRKVLYGAVKGAVAAAGDEYTSFFDPEELKNFKTDLQGSFDGIGAEIGKKNGVLVIVAPLDDSPAKRAGLLPQDIIVSVNGEPAANWSVEEAVSNIRGPKGTEVTLAIFREGRTSTFDVTIKRETIQVKSVKWETREQNGKVIGLITLSRFGDDTKALFSQAVQELLAKNISGLVVDVRNNPGGYLEGSVEVSSYWVRAGELVVKEARGDGTEDTFNSYGYKRLETMKTAILINGGSASAAEIFSGALRDHNLATLIGEKSFGKGSVQEIIELPQDTAVKVTIAKWITPGGKNLHKEGLTPDIEVKRTEEDITNNRDPQLDRALEEVSK